MLWFVLGHGPFRSYLNRFGLSEETDCRLCDCRSIESPAHLTLECDGTAGLRPEDEDDPTKAETMLRKIVLMIYRKEREREAFREN